MESLQPPPGSAELTESQLVAENVDVREWGPTEDDEEKVLASLYGQSDPDGVYRGKDLGR